MLVVLLAVLHSGTMRGEDYEGGRLVVLGAGGGSRKSRFYLFLGGFRERGVCSRGGLGGRSPVCRARLAPLKRFRLSLSCVLEKTFPGDW